MVMKCPSCGAENPDHADYCNLCLSTVGFECAEYTAPAARGEGFTSKYPSSFDTDSQPPPTEPPADQPLAGPVDIGKYGVRSGEQVVEGLPEGAQTVKPVDIGQYGSQSGHEPHEPAPLPRDYGDGGHKKRRRRHKR